MKNSLTLAIVLFAVVASGCFDSGSDSPGSSNNPPTIDNLPAINNLPATNNRPATNNPPATTKSLIVGTWEYTDPSNGCVYSFAYKADKTFSFSSLDKRASGTYTFNEEANTSDRHLLKITITSDNGRADCDGDSYDAEGEGNTWYVEFTNNNKSITFYSSATGRDEDEGVTYTNTNTSNPAPPAPAATKSLIVGTWALTDQSNGCVESWTYNEDKTFSYRALDKRASGTYTFNQKANSSGRHLLKETFTSDNGRADCDGDSYDVEGEEATYYVEFTSSNNRITFFDSASGGVGTDPHTRQ